MDPRMYPGAGTIAEVSVDIGSVAANTTADTTVTVPGIVNGKSAVTFVNPASSLNAGLGIAAVFVSGDNQITVRCINTTAGALNPAAATWVIGYVKYKS